MSGHKRRLRFALIQLARFTKLQHAFLVSALMTVLLCTEYFALSVPYSTFKLALLAGFFALVIYRGVQWILFQLPDANLRQKAKPALEIGCLLTLAAQVAVQLSGGPHSTIYPVVYILVSFLVAFNRVRVGLTFVALNLLVELGGNLFGTHYQRDLPTFFWHASFIIAFPALPYIYVQGEILHSRVRQRREMEKHMQSIEEDAKDFRLISSVLSLESHGLSREVIENRRRISSVKIIRESMYHLVEMVDAMFQSHSTILFMLDYNDKIFKIKELVSKSDWVRDTSIPAGEGVLGGMLRTQKPMLLSDLKDGFSGITYYLSPHPIRALMAVPVMDGGFVRGVLCVDRTDNRPFTQNEQHTLELVGKEIERIIEAEKLLSAMDRTKSEKDRLFRATQLLNKSLGLTQVFDSIVEAAKTIHDYSFMAITTYDVQRQLHTIVRIQGCHQEILTGTTFPNSAQCLVTSAFKTQHPLPQKPFHLLDKSRQFVFSKQTHLNGIKSLRVIPMTLHNETLGTIILGDEREGVLSQDDDSVLLVFAYLAAMSIVNGRMYQKMEMMATTDGLTGLINHRTAQELLEDALARAQRFNRKLTLILTDIDHFKKINDTYGHPVGDVVLKKVAQALGESARKTDSVARYGGEEFLIIMEETDTVGGQQMAERIRQAVAQISMPAESGPFHISMSLGIATFPEHSKQKEELVNRADQALYHAKHTGRNRTCLYTETLKNSKNIVTKSEAVVEGRA